MAHSQLGWQEKMSGGDYQDVGRVVSGTGVQLTEQKARWLGAFEIIVETWPIHRRGDTEVKNSDDYQIPKPFTGTVIRRMLQDAATNERVEAVSCRLRPIRSFFPHVVTLTINISIPVAFDHPRSLHPNPLTSGFQWSATPEVWLSAPCFLLLYS